MKRYTFSIGLGLAALGSLLLIATAGSTDQSIDDLPWYPKQFQTEERVTERGTSLPSQRMNIYIGDRQMRYEVFGEGDQLLGAGIYRFDNEGVVVINWSESMSQYYEVREPLDSVRSMRQFMQSPEASSHPCQSDSKVQCEPLGSETIAGRMADVYAITAPDGDGYVSTDTMWIDRELYYPLREVDSTTVTEVVTLEVGPQPDHLFKVPDGYTKAN